MAFCWWTKGYYDKTVAFWCQICRDTLCASAAAAVKRTNEAKAAEGRSFIVGSTRGAQSRYDDYSKQCRRQGSGVCSLDVSRGHPRCTPSDLVPVAFSTWFLWHFSFLQRTSIIFLKKFRNNLLISLKISQKSAWKQSIPRIFLTEKLERKTNSFAHLRYAVKWFLIFQFFNLRGTLWLKTEERR